MLSLYGILVLRAPPELLMLSALPVRPKMFAVGTQIAIPALCVLPTMPVLSAQLAVHTLPTLNAVRHYSCGSCCPCGYNCHP